MRTLENMLEVAVAAVEDAERLFTDGLGAMPAHHKKQGDFATEVDLAIEALLRSRLREETGIDVYGEEAGGVYNPEATWIVDPIDGTSNYAAGNPSCAILATLVLDDEPVVAVTSIPTLRTRLTAVKGGPVHLAAARCRPSPNATPWSPKSGSPRWAPKPATCSPKPPALNCWPG